MLNVDAMMVFTLLKMSVLNIMSVMKEFNIQINIVPTDSFSMNIN